VTEDHNSRISDLYRQSSQETPPAHVDQAVLDRARKSVRSRVFSPFGNHWVAGGAVAGVVMISVLLILSVPQQPDSYAPEQDAPVPSSEALPEVRKEAVQSDTLPSELPAATEAKQAAPPASKARPPVFETLQDREASVPEDETAARMQQKPAPATAAEQPVSTTVPATAADQPVSATAPAAAADQPVSATAPAETWYLQVGSFREQSHAVLLKTKLAGLGFKSVIQEVSIKNMDVYHRVRVGPFTDHDALKQSKRKLDELGIGTLTVKNRE
jgi:cell division protein FtsN